MHNSSTSTKSQSTWGQCAVTMTAGGSCCMSAPQQFASCNSMRALSPANNILPKPQFSSQPSMPPRFRIQTHSVCASPPYTSITCYRKHAPIGIHAPSLALSNMECKRKIWGPDIAFIECTSQANDRQSWQERTFLCWTAIQPIAALSLQTAVKIHF
jgi:hypothetical protein